MSKLYKSKQIAIIMIIAVSIASLNGCNTINESKEIKHDINSHEEDTQNIQDDEKAIIDLLVSQGVDRDKLEPKAKTGSGATILGDALPVNEFNTLASAEEYLGYYLGLHNKIEKLEGYELSRIFMVGDKFMQASYDHINGDKSITVKTSKIVEVNELISVYNDMEYSTKYIINNTEVNIGGADEDKLHIAYFSLPNDKKYSIHSEYGLSQQEIKSLLGELIGNIQIMADWEV